MIKTPLTYGDALELVSAVACPDCSRERLVRLMMAVDTASREQAWEDKGGPALLKALDAVTPLLERIDALAGGQPLVPQLRSLLAMVTGRA